MHYLVRQVYSFYLSSWQNKAYLLGLATLSFFIVLGVAWQVYDGINVFNIIYKPQAAEKVLAVKQVTTGKMPFQPSVIFGSYKKAIQRVNRSLTLLGVIESTNYKHSSAIIALKNGKGEFYSVGEEISPGLTLYRVFDDRVILNRGGVLETLYLGWGNLESPATSGLNRLINSIDSQKKSLLENNANIIESQKKSVGNKLYNKTYHIKDLDLEEIKKKFQHLRQGASGGYK